MIKGINRLTCPAGIWNIENLIGAKVAIRSTGICNLSSGWADDDYIIKDIYFRISTDGKTITLVELEGLEGETFTFKDLEVLGVVGEPQPSAGIVIGNTTI